LQHLVIKAHSTALVAFFLIPSSWIFCFVLEREMIFDEGREIGHQLGWAQRLCFHHTLNYFLIKKQKQEAIMYFF
jgi:hypothetical protein